MQVACNAIVKISYHVKQKKRSIYRRATKTPEKAATQLKIPADKRAIGTRLSMEFHGNESEQSTV